MNCPLAFFKAEPSEALGSMHKSIYKEDSMPYGSKLNVLSPVLKKEGLHGWYDFKGISNVYRIQTLNEHNM